MTNEEKKIFLNQHFFYEIIMLNYSVKILTNMRNQEELLNNLALESFLTHSRNIIYFLYDQKSSERRQNEDAIASNFFASPIEEWKRIRPRKTDYIKQVEERADKEVMHLSFARNKVTLAEKEWKPGLIFNDLLVVIKKFLDNIPQIYKGDNLNNIDIRLNST